MTESDYNDCVKDYADKVYRFIVKDLGHEEDAKDIVQGAFEKMWAVRLTIDRDRCKSYLFTIAYNLMIDHIRKVKRLRLKEDMSEAAGVLFQPSNDHRKILERALATLSDTQRSLVLLKDYEGYSYEEIGRITSLSESQVKVYLFRARMQLKAFLGKKENVI